ncbi:hypothetical protein G4B88_001329 [Cannabis sativa]|uniref:Reverse transcriptase zinc-binding domain-containing protein n=1 Tax=Cannabis sativa TaxID=3483 RepID=A0A7J6HZR3_CANSA|nr:hypothetical protein G4B88_001329 [Cannabis sativa]
MNRTELLQRAKYQTGLYNRSNSWIEFLGRFLVLDKVPRQDLSPGQSSYCRPRLNPRENKDFLIIFKPKTRIVNKVCARLVERKIKVERLGFHAICEIFSSSRFGILEKLSVKEKHQAYMTAKERLAQVRCQQSKINWIKFNDENSSYFHAILNLRDNLDEARLCQAIKGGKFSAKRYYNLSIEVAKVDYAKASWDKLMVPKHRFIFWQILNSQLLTRDYLGRILSIQNVQCPVIVAVMEWLGCFSWPRTHVELLNWCKNLNQQPQMRVLNTVVAATLYSVWKNRNCCIFDLCCAAPRRVSLDVRKIVQLRLLGKGPFEDCRKNIW